MSFAENIKIYRTAAGLTQEQLALAVGISGQAVSKWENDESMPDPALLPDIADALNVTIDELYGHTPKSTEAVYRLLGTQIQGLSRKEAVRKIYEIVLSALRSFFVEDPVPEMKNGDPTVSEDSRKLAVAVTRNSVTDDSGFAAAFESDLFPYAAILMKPADGFASLLNSKPAWEYIVNMADEEVMKCIRYLFTREEHSFTMETSLLMKKAGCDAGRMEETLAKLQKIGLIVTENVEINGKLRHLATHYRGKREMKQLMFFAAAYSAAVLNHGNHRAAGSFEKTIL